MTTTTLARFLWVPLLAAAGIVAAPSGCGGSNDGYIAFADAGGVPDGTTVQASGSSSGGGSSGGSDDSSGQCVSSCTSDEQCQTSCPPAQNGGINCCDLGSGVCAMMSGSTCPGPADGGSE